MIRRVGELLFKWRSFTPLLLLPVVVPLLMRSRGAASIAWVVGGLFLCAVGQLLRLAVLGQVPDGTSGQNEVLIATALNTSGPYAYARNPLYLGNLGITAGLCVVSHSVPIVVVVCGLFAVQYRAIIAAEEGFLRRQFGAAYDAYCARVPRFWPAMSPRTDGAARPFSWKRAIWKEHNPAASWLLLAVALLGWDAIALRQSIAPHVATAAAIVVVYLAVKGWKHHWFSGGFVRDLKRRIRETAR